MSPREERRPGPPRGPQPLGVGFGGLCSENPHHLAKSGDTGLTGDRREVDEDYGPSARRNTGPQRVGEREIIDESVRAWSETFGE